MSNNKKSTAPPDPGVVGEALSNSILREMVNELEETKLKLLLNIKELKEKLTQQKDDQADIYYYLNKKCDESFEVIASLEEQIINEQTDREIAEKMYENKVEELKAAQVVMEGKYTSKISELETRLEMLNSFSEEKEESEKNLKLLMGKLEDERNQFKTNTESIENRFLLERDKLRKTYDQKYERIKKELEASVEGKMSNKTKKTQIMNVIMKKELDSQSQHAEKLLEINQSMMDRDKALKLELDVVNSLHNDMTLRLAMSQRTIKALNEKVAAMEATNAATQQSHEAKLREKAEAMIQLEARLNNLNKRARSENSKIDDVWGFLAQSFALLSAPSDGKQTGRGHKPKSKTSTAADTAVQLASWTGNVVEHEKLLVSLVREVTRKFPQLFERQQSAAGDHVKGEDRGGSERGGICSTASYLVRSSSLQGGEDNVSSFSLSTGIPAWDMKVSLEVPNGRGATKQRSIAVQTEGKLAPYPDGSLWMEAPGARSLLFQQQSAALAATTDIDNNSVGFQSVQSLWRSVDTDMAHANAAEGIGSLSLLSNDDNYSTKTASHVLHGPPREKAKPSKIIAKMRRQNMRKQAKMFQAQDDQGGGGVGLLGIDTSGGPHGHYGEKAVRAPVSLHLQAGYPNVPSPLSLGSGSHLLPPGGGMGRPYPYAGAQQKASSVFSPTMSISGQGFVPPLVLPKL